MPRRRTINTLPTPVLPAELAQWELGPKRLLRKGDTVKVVGRFGMQGWWKVIKISEHGTDPVVDVIKDGHARVVHASDVGTIKRRAKCNG